MFTTNHHFVQRLHTVIPLLVAFLALYVFVPITLAAASGSPTPT